MHISKGERFFRSSLCCVEKSENVLDRQTDRQSTDMGRNSSNLFFCIIHFLRKRKSIFRKVIFDEICHRGAKASCNITTIIMILEYVLVRTTSIYLFIRLAVFAFDGFSHLFIQSECKWPRSNSYRQTQAYVRCGTKQKTKPSLINKKMSLKSEYWNKVVALGSSKINKSCIVTKGVGV